MGELKVLFPYFSSCLIMKISITKPGADCLWYLPVFPRWHTEVRFLPCGWREGELCSRHTFHLWAGEVLAGGWPLLNSGSLRILLGKKWSLRHLKYGCHFQKYLINKEQQQKKILKSIKSLKVIHRREIKHSTVFWQSWWFLCAVLTANVPREMFALITWNTPVEPFS